MKNPNSSIKAGEPLQEDILQEFTSPFNLESARTRIDDFYRKHPTLQKEIDDLKQKISDSVEVKKYQNKEDAADFSISEILRLNEDEVFWKANYLNLEKPFSDADAAKSLVRKIIELSEENIKSSEENKDLHLINLAAGKYIIGFGVTKDLEEAARLYTLAANLGYVPAQHNLGVSYHYGEGVKKNLEEAARLYTLAADQGCAPAQHGLGVCYHNGEGVEKNLEEAVRLFTLAAKQGYAPAQHNLGFCYLYGAGVEQNLEEAAILYTSAAKQGYAPAQYGLGVCYHYGKGVEKNLEEAVRLFTLAAKQGYAPAQHNLGFCYHYGKGVEKNLEEAAILYALAADQGHARAQVGISDLNLSSAELLKVYSKLASVKDVDINKSKSCETIANLWAKKLGEEIGIKDKELEEIKVLSRNADSIECQLPRGLGTKSSASFSFSSLFTTDSRKQNLKNKKDSGNSGITNLEKDANNFVVTASATAIELIETLPQRPSEASSYLPPQLPGGGVTLEEIYPDLTPSSASTVISPFHSSLLKEGGGVKEKAGVTKKKGL